MKSVIRMLCATAVAMPLWMAAGSAYAQTNINPDLGTPCSQGGVEACNPAQLAPWWRGGHVYRDYRPVYPHWRDIRNHRQTRRDAHEEWCYGTYRSYRAWDNTFKPYSGPRKQCNSPYG
jgi:coproporphyrinogen III oxidase